LSKVSSLTPAVAPDLQAKRDHLAGRLAELRAGLGQVDPLVVAANTGAIYRPDDKGEGAFYLRLWGEEVKVTFPHFVAYGSAAGKALPSFLQALLAYYFSTGDGSPPAGRWIAFSELPDGHFYTQAFQGYTGHELAKAFGNGIDHFAAAATSLDGRRQSLGDAAYAFEVLPRVELLAVFWQGDEEFPPSFRILFDAAISHYLSTDTCAIAGAMLTGRLIKALHKIS
jgi:hypothetical protein